MAIGLLQSWNGLGRVGKAGLVGGAFLCLALVVGGFVFSLRPDYRVLFSQLSEGDAAAIVQDLKRAKTPYRLAAGGTTIEVPAERVHETRLALMSTGAPLAGGVGFEIFDKQGLGATEQTQRVSYQRALQGELARTIGAMEGVRQARVHLVLPESALFRRNQQEARAAVSLALEAGTVPSREQILGIQRLVAASVASLDAARVVVTDQRGITLSGAGALETASPGGGEARLTMKREIEDYLTRKVAKLLDGTFGPGRAIVSVDVALNFDEIRRTVQDLLPMPAGAGSQAGVLRKREVLGAAPAADAAWEADGAIATSRAGSSTEVEYEYGRRLEQVVAAPGGVERISIGVVVPGGLPAEQQARIADLVRMAAGLDASRGDAVVVQPLENLSVPVAQVPAVGEHAASALAAVPDAVTPVAIEPTVRRGSASGIALIGGLILLVVAMLAWRGGSRRTARLSQAERQRLLADVQRTFAAELAAPEARRAE